MEIPPFREWEGKKHSPEPKPRSKKFRETKTLRQQLRREKDKRQIRRRSRTGGFSHFRHVFLWELSNFLWRLNGEDPCR